MKSKFYLGASGILIGTLNSFFGTGGGIIAVPVLEKLGLSKKESHANAVAVILPISILSAVLYLVGGKVSLSDASPFILTGIIGSVLGTVILKKISPFWLKRIFGIFVIYAGLRLLLK
jgi:uncharacterized membrane protein YfcA